MVAPTIGYNEQVLLQVWNSLLVSPEPLLIRDMTRPEKSCLVNNDNPAFS
jgi:hypothetical protein